MNKTALHQEHVASGAKMVEFAGWHMPIQFTTISEEHLIEERDLHGYAASEHQHKVSTVEGCKNRYLLIYRLAMMKKVWQNGNYIKQT